MSTYRLASNADAVLNGSLLLRPTPPPGFQTSINVQNLHNFENIQNLQDTAEMMKVSKYFEISEAKEPRPQDGKLRYIPLAPPGLESLKSRQSKATIPLPDSQAGAILDADSVLKQLMVKGNDIELSSADGDVDDSDMDSDLENMDSVDDMDELDSSSDDDASSVTLGSSDTDSDSQSDVSMSDGSSDSESATSSEIDTIEFLNGLKPYPHRPTKRYMYSPQEPDEEDPENSTGSVRRDRHLRRRLIARPVYAKHRPVGVSELSGKPPASPGQTYVTAGRTSEDKKDIDVNPFIHRVACDYADAEAFRRVAGVATGNLGNRSS